MNKDIRTYNNQGQRHGYCEWYWGNYKMGLKCTYHNGRELGYEEVYNYKGGLKDKAFYII